MKTPIKKLLIISHLSLFFISGYAQQSLSALKEINIQDLQNHISYLSSPLLKGRMNGSEGLELATSYIAKEVQLSGLNPANKESYYQEFSVTSRKYDPLNTSISVTESGKISVNIDKPFYEVVPMGISEMDIEGEVVFAGYGINSARYNYNDFDSIDTDGKIVLIMNRAPMSEDGKKCLLTEPAWTTLVESLSAKLSALLNSGAKAILVVMDPKSGSESLSDEDPGLAEYLSVNMSLKGNDPRITIFPRSLRIIVIHRELADALLNGTGYTLEELQNMIDSDFKPHSFSIENKKIKIVSKIKTEDKVLKNVAGFVEGRDPVLKEEVVVFSAHLDHIGMSVDGKIFPGADDDASGCAALLELAQAFSNLKKKPLRSVLFLWVSGEEIGLYGSESYVNNPLFPTEKTVADINLDMIGRTRSNADTSEANPVAGPDTVFIISDNQSSDLNKIASKVDSKSILYYDYALSDKNHPLHFFERSDQYNFVQMDIPILLFTTGLHTTYHTPEDTMDKIDFSKLELITKNIFEIGYTVANRRKRIAVNNPFSSW